MRNTLIDKLNQILINVLEYKELLQELAETISDKTTSKKLEELAHIKEKQSEELIKRISKKGGDIESSERLTDQASVSWISGLVPEEDDMEAILSVLINAEKNALQAYQEILNGVDMDDELKIELETHFQEAEVNLKYFETAKETLAKRN